VARTQTLAEAVRIAEMMCQGAPGAVQAALRAVREGTAEAEGREYGRVVRMGDRDEALRAFGEARGVVWRGR
jgi:methylglutaconyl-CoA hydratase